MANKQSLSLIIVLILLLFPFEAACQNTIFTIESIVVKGNNITRRSIIDRELTIKQGDTISSGRLQNELENSTSNLKNISLFNFITLKVDTSILSQDRLTITVDVIERWYIWPYPIIDVADRNFNSWWKSKNLDHLTYGFYVQADNFRGRAEQLMVLFKWGFDRRLEIKYTFPNINHRKTLGLSIKAGFMRNHEVALKTNYDNTITFLRSSQNYLREESLAEIAINYRPAYFTQHSISLGILHESLNDTMSIIEPMIWPKGSITFLNLAYQFRFDKRNYKHYPLQGHYIDFSAGSFYNINQKPFTSSFFKIESNLRYYLQLKEKTYLSTGIYAKVTSENNVPYFFAEGLGTGRNFVRGYEYYLINGQKIFVGKLILKYALIPSRNHQITWLRNIKFSKIHYAIYLNLFTDHGIAMNRIKSYESKFTDKWLSSIGVGLDLVTYYDRVFRVEYTINKEKESGVYLHFIAPI
jgi:outer membrane protein assembly factor BamA